MPLLITYLKIIVKLDIELIQYKPLIYTHSLKSVCNTTVSREASKLHFKKLGSWTIEQTRFLKKFAMFIQSSNQGNITFLRL